MLFEPPNWTLASTRSSPKSTNLQTTAFTPPMNRAAGRDPAPKICPRSPGFQTASRAVHEAKSFDDALAIEMGEEPLDAERRDRLGHQGLLRCAMTYVLQLAEELRFRFRRAAHQEPSLYDDELRPEGPPGRWRAGPIYVQKEETGEIVYEGVDVVSDRWPRARTRHLPAESRWRHPHRRQSRDGSPQPRIDPSLPRWQKRSHGALPPKPLVLAREGIVSRSFFQHRGIPRPEYALSTRRSRRSELAHGNQPETRPWIRYVLTLIFAKRKPFLRRTNRDRDRVPRTRTTRRRYRITRANTRSPLRRHLQAPESGGPSTARSSKTKAMIRSVNRPQPATCRASPTMGSSSLTANAVTLLHGRPRSRRHPRACDQNRDPRDDSDPFAVPASIPHKKSCSRFPGPLTAAFHFHRQTPRVRIRQIAAETVTWRRQSVSC